MSSGQRLIEPKPASNDSDLPDSIPELLELSDSIVEAAQSVEDFEEAARVLEKAKRKIGDSLASVEPLEIYIRLAKTCFQASEWERDGTEKRNWLIRGEDAAAAAARERPDRVEGHYFLAVIKGRRAEQGGLSGLGRIKDIEELGLKSVELDPTYEDGGPFRLLAMLYAKAPPWPTSLGDMDLAMEFAAKALEISDYPLNHLIMAEVLIEEGDLTLARERLRTVLAAPKTGRWAMEGEYWRPYARQLLDKIK